MRPGPRARHGRKNADPSEPAGALNEVVSPSAEEIAAARKIVAAFELPENQGKGAISLDGRMVERLHADIARETLALADAIAAKQ